MEKNNISIILPVHSLDEVTKQLFANAVGSVKTQSVRPDELVIVVPTDSEAATFVKAFDYGDYKDSVTIAENSGKTDFATQVNYGVSQCNSEWFSLLEYDDEFASIWFKNVIQYRTAHPEIEIFMPIIVDIDSTNKFIGFTNEAVWANGFSDKLGVLDNNALLAYQNFNIDGIVVKKSVFDSFGGFKSNIKLTFIYEFLLRMTLKDVKLMVIPKFGYKHINQRLGSLFSEYKNTIDPIEARWWLGAAKKECYHGKDREITYTTQTA